MTQAVTISDSYEEACYCELIPYLVQMNRCGLIGGIKQEIKNFNRAFFIEVKGEGGLKYPSMTIKPID